MTAEYITGIAGILIALLFAYVPGLNTWYAALDSQKKSLLMLGVLAVVSAALYGLVCAGWAADLRIPLTCDKTGVIELVKAFVAALVANQATYLIAPQTAKVIEAKDARG